MSYYSNWIISGSATGTVHIDSDDGSHVRTLDLNVPLFALASHDDHVIIITPSTSTAGPVMRNAVHIFDADDGTLLQTISSKASAQHVCINHEDTLGAGELAVGYTDGLLCCAVLCCAVLCSDALML